jgi:predicted TIM-barrel fold metal-dependent hydrolase
MATRKSDHDDELESPIAFVPCSNGEHAPAPTAERDRRAHRRFLELVEQQHKRLGISRRAFIDSACGTAAALLVINELYGCSGEPQPATRDTTKAGSGSGRSDAGYAVTPEMTLDAALACEALAGDELVIDVQMHPPNPLSPWTDRELPMDAETFITTAFVDSDTAVGVLSGIPDVRDLGLPNVEADRMLQEVIARLGGPRLRFHANVKPDRGPSELDYMAQVIEKYNPAAWKVYPHVGAWRLDSDEVGLPFIEQGRKLGVHIIAAHRGIADDAGDYAAPSSPVDLVQAAKMFPDVSFLTYHSGWQANVDENHPFDPDDQNPSGVDRLIKAVIDQQLGQNGGNVYAELGSTWRSLMTSPEQAAHVLGKLLKYLGEDRVLWGTDSVFTGSPQEQIAAFRTFQIPTALQDQHGYPALTPRIKTKVLGENATRVYGIDPNEMRCAIHGDFIDQLKTARRDDPHAVPVPRQKAYGPRTRREFLAFTRWEKAFKLA